MTRSLLKDTLRTVKNHFSRYVSILLIVALGTAFFVGIKASAPDMFSTAAQYFIDYNLMDIRLQSSLGLTDADVNAVKNIEGVDYAAGVKFTDALVRVNGEIEADIDGTQISTRAYSISPADIANFLSGSNDGDYINRVRLIEGRYPANVNECLVDASELSTPDSFTLGSTITLENSVGEQPEDLNTAEFMIVGIISSPYYLSFERGNTNIGSGKIGTYIVIPEEAFSADYYSEIYVTVTGSDSYDPFSEDYYTYIRPYAATIEAISPTLINNRVVSLRPELLSRIQNGEAALLDGEQEFNASMTQLNETISQLQQLTDNGEQLVATAQAEFDEKFADAQTALQLNQEEYNLAIADYREKKATLDANQAEYDEKLQQSTDARALYDEINTQVEKANNKLATLKTTVSTTKSLIEACEDVLTRLGDRQQNAYSDEQIQSVIGLMQTMYPELYNSIKALTTSGLAGEIIEYTTPYLNNQKEKLEDAESQLEEQQLILSALKIQLDRRKATLEAATQELAQAKIQLQQSTQALEDYYDQLTANGIDLRSAGLELELERLQAEQSLNTLKQQVAAAPDNLAAALERKAEAEASYELSRSYAERQLADAKSLYARLDTVRWDIYTRDDTPGYTSYGQSVKNIEVLSDIFPIFFFIISSLVCLTTVTRLVEEDRTVLGTYRALGYSTGAILSKYVVYSLSACVFGAAIGIGAGVFVFPYAINRAYSVMYTLPEIRYAFPWFASILGFLIALLSTTLVTLFAVLRDLTLTPSVLMRPKAPKTGKRILLENIRFIWKHLSFPAKITLRNLFRNKSRFFMTLTGIAGSAALLLASLGMYNSISAIKTRQYGEDAISKYDLQIIFDDPQTTPVYSEAYRAAAADARISALCLTSMKSMVGYSDRSDERLDVYVLVPEKPETFDRFVSLRDRDTGNEIPLNDSGAVISEKLAAATNTKAGDAIFFTDASGNSYGVVVAGITENYTFHYIYMTPAVYQAATGTAPIYSYAIGNIDPGIKTSKTTDLSNVKGLLATDLMKISGITTVAYTSDTTETIARITDALSIVIALFFVSALILAVVVLYNLSNINIIERTRELATLKVLGFNEKEVRRYILRENAIVSFFGILFGLLLGVGLHRLLITFTAIDAVMYGQSIAWYSYLITVVVTILFISVVNLILRKKTERIDMVESLKSVE